MAIIPFVLGLIVTFGAWAYDVRQRNKELAAVVDTLSRKHKEDHDAWTAYANALRAEGECRLILLNQIADTWVENLDSACAIIAAPKDSETKQRRRDAQEAHKRAADIVVSLGYGSPSSGVMMIRGVVVKEVANG
jgi:hypothetical protein